MAFHKIGENAKVMEPTGAKFDHSSRDASYKVNSAEAVSDEVINSWFQDAFLALQNDPYIHMKMDSAEHLQNLFMFNKDGDRLINFSANGGTIEQFNMADKRNLFEAAQEGQLFYYDPSLGKSGGMRQIYTKMSELKPGVEDWKLLVTEAIDQLPARVEEPPKEPSWWTYVKAFFRVSSARAEIQAYNNQLAEYNHADAQCKAFGKVKAELLDAGKNPDSPCKAASAERNKRIEEYKAALPKKEAPARILPQKQQAVDDGKLPYETATIRRGLKEFLKEGMEKCFQRMTFTQDSVPANNLGIDGLKLGALVSMAMGSRDISIKIRGVGDQPNNPEVNYDKIVGGKYFKNNQISGKGEGFLRSASKATAEAMAAADGGDFSKLGKLIAEGLIQNNRVLKAHKELTNVYSGYAQLGGIILDIMEEHPQLKTAVMDHLGPDADKQLHMANAARNIGKLREDAMEAYQKMSKNFHVMADVKTTDDNGNEIIRKRPVNTYSIQDITKVALLCDIEVDMNAGKFDLETTEFADPNKVPNVIKDYANSAVLDAFLWDANRGDILPDPIAMQNLFHAATDHLKEMLDLKKVERELGAENDDLYMGNENVFGIQVADDNFDAEEFLYGPDEGKSEFLEMPMERGNVGEPEAEDKDFDVQDFLYDTKAPENNPMVR